MEIQSEIQVRKLGKCLVNWRKSSIFKYCVGKQYRLLFAVKRIRCACR